MKTFTYKKEKNRYKETIYFVFCDSINIGYIQRDNILNEWGFWIDSNKNNYQYEDGFEQFTGGLTLKETKETLELVINRGFTFGMAGKKISLDAYFPGLKF